MPMGQMPVGRVQTIDQNSSQIHKAELPEICDQQNVRATARGNTWQNTKGTLPIPGQKLKFLTPPGIEPGRRFGRRDSTDNSKATNMLVVLVFGL